MLSLSHPFWATEIFWEAWDACPIPSYAVVCSLSNLLYKIKRELPLEGLVTVNDIKWTSLLLSPYKELRRGLSKDKDKSMLRVRRAWLHSSQRQSLHSSKVYSVLFSVNAIFANIYCQGMLSGEQTSPSWTLKKKPARQSQHASYWVLCVTLKNVASEVVFLRRWYYF